MKIKFDYIKSRESELNVGWYVFGSSERGWVIFRDKVVIYYYMGKFNIKDQELFNRFGEDNYKIMLGYKNNGSEI